MVVMVMERCVMDGVRWEDKVRVCGSDWSDLIVLGRHGCSVVDRAAGEAAKPSSIRVSSYTDDCVGRVHV